MPDARGTDERLLSAALEAASELGVAGATTRRIAERAGVNEVTLFRRFGSKRSLLAAALRRAAGDFAGAATEPSGRLEPDLRRIAAAHAAFVDRHPELVVRLLPELARDPDLAAAALPAQQAIAGALRAVVVHHQATGELEPENPDDTVRAFMGPLLARAALRHVLGPAEPLDAAGHVRRFLEGRRCGRT